MGSKVPAYLLIGILAGALGLALDVCPVRASGTIYIRADGSIDPLDAPIITYDHITYALTGNITSSGDGIVVQRDNIIVDGVGYTLQGFPLGYTRGIDVSSRSNVTIRNIHITHHIDCIVLDSSSSSTISGSTITANPWKGKGIWLKSSSSITISDNTIANSYLGIALDSSSNSTISGNTITANNQYGILFNYSPSNNVSGNTIANQYIGIMLDSSSSNTISGNTVTANNGVGIWLSFSSSNTISGNTVANNDYTPTGVSESGIWLDGGSSNTVSGNTFTNDGLWVLYSFSNSVANNTVNGKPLVYLEGVSDYTVIDAGQVILVRCENIRVEGLNLSRTSVGIELFETDNSNISGNTITANHWDGITLSSSSNSTISGNTITANNGYGITHSTSSNSTISGNTITANHYAGLYLHFSSSNSVSGNAIANNDYEGIYLQYSPDNHISGNNITGNPLGIEAYSSPGNRLYHNNLIDNTQQVYSTNAMNIWDDGYPYGGNYWSDFTDIDEYQGEYQNETGRDGIWDHPYVIDADNQDRYPLTTPYGPLVGDLDGDLDVDLFDVVAVCSRYGCREGDLNWNPMADLAPRWGVIDIFDCVTVAYCFGKQSY